jgi:hypothetical protein
MNTSSLKKIHLMPDSKESESTRDFSGKLPFRTQPEVHESIFLAAKQAGKSINAWMEEILRDAAKKSSVTASETFPKNSQSIQTIQKLFQEQPDVVFELIDEIKPALKSNKTRDTVVLMGEIEKLVTNYELLQSQVRNETKDEMAALIKSVLDHTETFDPGKGLMACVSAIESTLLPRLQQPDSEHILQCTQAIGQFLISMTAIRLCLKDSSLENTLNILHQVIYHFSGQ